MTILNHIIATKHKEVAVKKNAIPVALLEQSPLFSKESISLVNQLRNSNTGIIAEFKRRSPSKVVINNTASVQDVAVGYENAGVCGMSVLTDTPYFGGSLDDLLMAETVVSLPLLRKEFIIDSYQIYEAKAYGADTILLIAAALTKKELKIFSETAKKLDLDVLLEVHNREELEKSLLPTVDMLGVNNRNLKTFKTTIEISKELSVYIPDEFLKVSESGISTPEAVRELREYGYQGFLIGEKFMKTENPSMSAKEFINQLK